MQAGYIFAWITFLEILCGKGQVVDNPSEDIERLFQAIMTNLKEKDDRITALEKQYTESSEISSVPQGTDLDHLNEIHIRKILSDNVQLKNDIRLLRSIIRTTLHNEKLVLRETKAALIKQIDDFKIDVKTEMAKVDAVVNDSNNNQADLRQELATMNSKILAGSHIQQNLQSDIANVERKLTKTNTLVDESIKNYEQLRYDHETTQSEFKIHVKTLMDKSDAIVNDSNNNQANLQQELAAMNRKIFSGSRKQQNVYSKLERQIIETSALVDESVEKYEKLRYDYDTTQSEYKEALCYPEKYDSCINGDCCIHQKFRSRNLALKQTATQSSTYVHCIDCVAELAVDGNRNKYISGGSCTHTNDEDMPWWLVYLGDVFPVKIVIIYNRADCCGSRLRNILITVSSERDDDGEECGRIDGPASDGQVVGVRCKNKMAGKYVKIQRQDSGVLTLCEVEIY